MVLFKKKCISKSTDTLSNHFSTSYKVLQLLYNITMVEILPV